MTTAADPGAAAATDVVTATYAAMRELPPHVRLAQSLLEAGTAAERAALLDSADRAVLEAAFAYAAEPEHSRERSRRLAWMWADPRRVAALKLYYRDHIADFISDWMTVTDPRRAARGQSAQTPFTLWPKQQELVEFILERIRHQEPGIVVKGRDVGATSVCVAVLAACCIFQRDFAAGIISSTEAKLDRYQDTIFQKLRGLLRSLPVEFRAGYDEQRTDMYLSISFPETRSAITGATGNQAFRGLRQSVVLVDEAAHLLDSQAIDSALSAVSDARIDVSTPHGIGGSFYDRAHNPNILRFDLNWRDDPRRDQAWYAKQVDTLDPVVLGQEVNADFSASREGVVIPALWAQSAVGLSEKLGLTPAGVRLAALDLGDTGDRSALTVRHGVHLLHAESWSGAGSDLLKTVARAFRLCDEWNCTELVYDGDGLGASVKGDARVLNEQRGRDGKKPIKVTEYRGSSAPLYPTRRVPRSDRTWQDLAANRKAQSWWHLRMLFEQSHHAAKGEEYDKDAIICIDPKIPELSKLLAELSQPTMSENSAGKLLIDKLGDGERSPNCVDSVCMCFAIRVMPMRIADNFMDAFNDEQSAAGGFGGPIMSPQRIL
jgi:phage terminase large subunit